MLVEGDKMSTINIVLLGGGHEEVIARKYVKPREKKYRVLLIQESKSLLQTLKLLLIGWNNPYNIMSKIG